MERQVNTYLLIIVFCQTVNVVQSQPIIPFRISKSSFVGIPSFIEIYRTVMPLLKEGPASA